MKFDFVTFHILDFLGEAVTTDPPDRDFNGVDGSTAK